MFQHHRRKHVGGSPEKSKKSSPVVKKEALVTTNDADASDMLVEGDTASDGGALLPISNDVAKGSVTLNFAGGSDTFLVVDSEFDSGNLLEVSSSGMGVVAATAGDGTGLVDFVDASDVAESLLKFTSEFSDSNIMTASDVSVDDSKPSAKVVVTTSDVSVDDSKPSAEVVVTASAVSVDDSKPSAEVVVTASAVSVDDAKPSAKPVVTISDVYFDDTKPSAKPAVRTSDVSVIDSKIYSSLVPVDQLDPNDPGYGTLSDEWWFIRNPLNRHRFIIHPVDVSTVDEFLDNVKLIPESKYAFVRDTRLRQCVLGKDYAAICGKNGTLWQKFLEEFLPCDKGCAMATLKHIDLKEVYVTPMYTKDDMKIPQRPHIDFHWETLLLSRKKGRFASLSGEQISLKYGNMPYTAHLPLSREGSWIFLWNGPGPSVPFHIKYGFMLILRGDVVHSGGNPFYYDHVGKRYPRIHFYLLTSPADHPGDSVSYHNYDGEYFDREYYHLPEK